MNKNKSNNGLVVLAVIFFICYAIAYWGRVYQMVNPVQPMHVYKYDPLTPINPQTKPVKYIP